MALARARTLDVEGAAPEPILKGRHLIGLGLGPGPHLGSILKACYAAQLEGEFSTLEGGLDYARRRWGVGSEGAHDGLRRITRLALGAALVAALLGFVTADAARRGRASRAGDREEVLEAGVFLVATHRLIDPRFSRSVILLTRYGPQGAMGVIVNRPTEHRLSDLLPEIEALEGRGDRLFFGGPVSVNAIVLLLVRTKRWSWSTPSGCSTTVYLSGNPEAFALIAGRKKENPAIRGYAGYAGWGPGQLEAEIARKDWSIVRADASTIFRKEPSTSGRALARAGARLRAAL